MKLSALLATVALAHGAVPMTTESPREACDRLMNAVIPFAEEMLTKHGEFYPYGGALGPDGDVVSVGVAGDDEHPLSMDVIRDLKAALVSGARDGKYVATAIAFDARISMPITGELSDAVAIALDHVQDYSIVVYIPYELKSGAPEFGEPIAEPGAADIFGSR